MKNGFPYQESAPQSGWADPAAQAAVGPVGPAEFSLVQAPVIILQLPDYWVIALFYHFPFFVVSPGSVTILRLFFVFYNCPVNRAIALSSRQIFAMQRPLPLPLSPHVASFENPPERSN
jgi:hypothetical protein